MKIVFAGLAAAALVASAAALPALAMPTPAPGATFATTTPSVEKARVVCNWHRCWHVGYYRYYRPYGYYRPYYAPRLGVRVGPFGVRLF